MNIDLDADQQNNFSNIQPTLSQPNSIVISTLCDKLKKHN